MRENVLGADNQQERPAVRIWRAKREVRERARLQSVPSKRQNLKGFSPWGSASLFCWNPQRLYARFQFTLEKIQSELHGDMQRVAEMSTPLPNHQRRWKERTLSG